MDYRKPGKSQYLVVSLLLAVALLRLPVAFSHFIGNLAWLQLSIATNSRTEGKVQAAEAIELFQRAITIDTTNERVFWGMGTTYGVLGDEAAAIANWQKSGAAPNTLIAMADSLLFNEFYDEALTYYKGASELSLVQPSEASFLAANVCQRKFERLSVLNQANELFCRKYFDQNEGNLIVNGQFVGSELSGWNKRYFSRMTSVIYALDETTGHPPAAISVTGVTDVYHGGLFQTIGLPAGVEVRFGAWIKVQGAGTFNARLLYVGGQQDGQPFGNAPHSVSENMEWAYLERTIRLPRVDDTLYTFFPVLLTGKGRVWIDGVTLEIVPE